MGRIQEGAAAGSAGAGGAALAGTWGERPDLEITPLVTDTVRFTGANMRALFLLLLAIVFFPGAHAQSDLRSCIERSRSNCFSCWGGGPDCHRNCEARNREAENHCIAQDDRRRRIEQEQARFQQEQEDRRRRMEQNTPKPSDAESFNGPGSNQDFAVARYQCFRETQQIAVSASRDALGSSTSAGVQPSCAMFNACLAAKGYERVSSGRFNVTPDLAVKCSR